MDIQAPKILTAKLKKLGVVSVYLFGSAAKGKIGVLSDYDFAVLMKKQIPIKETFNMRLCLTAEFSKYLPGKSIDLIILNKTPPLLAANIIYDGKILFDADPKYRIAFETKTTMSYLDRLPYEERHLQTLTASI